MPIYQITIRNTKITNKIRLEKGMTVEVISHEDPVSNGGGKLVHEAFMRKYGIDSKSAGALTPGGYDMTKLK